MRVAYGLDAAMRSCALRILLAATISIARVIFFVLWTLAILVFPSFAPAVNSSSLRQLPRLRGLGRRELLDRSLDASLDVADVVALRVDLVDDRFFFVVHVVE